MKMLKSLVILCLVVSTNAYADFRKALDFLQKTQGTEMLVEVEDAVKSKNNDGLSLLLGTLGDRLINDEFYTLTATGDNFYINGKENEKKLLLGKNNIPELMGLLEKAVFNADLETQFDFAILKSKFNNNEKHWNVPVDELEKFAKLGNKKAQNILSSRKLYDSQSKKQPSLNLQETFDEIKQSAEQGNSDSAMRLAIIYLRWLPYEQQPDRVFFKVIPQNDKEGIYWLKRYAANAVLGDYIGPCKLADEYYAGDRIKKNNEQAYLWYMQSAFNTGFWQDECTSNGLRNMSYTGDLEILNPKLNLLIKEDDALPLRDYINSLSGQLEPPQDIKELKSPIKEGLLYSIKEDRYSLEVYKNGVVKFEGYSIGFYPPEIRTKVSSFIIGRDQWRISDRTLNDFTRELNRLNAKSTPNYIPESVLCDTGGHWRNGQIIINTDKTNKTIGYTTIGHTFSTRILAKIFKIQEEFIPTQHLRCGKSRIDNNYKNCVGADEWNIKSADENK